MLRDHNSDNCQKNLDKNNRKSLLVWYGYKWYYNFMCFTWCINTKIFKSFVLTETFYENRG